MVTCKKPRKKQNRNRDERSPKDKSCVVKRWFWSHHGGKPPPKPREHHEMKARRKSAKRRLRAETWVLSNHSGKPRRTRMRSTNRKLGMTCCVQRPAEDRQRIETRYLASRHQEKSYQSSNEFRNSQKAYSLSREFNENLERVNQWKTRWT